MDTIIFLMWIKLWSKRQQIEVNTMKRNRDSGGLRTDGLVVEDLGVAPVGVASSQLPHVKEGLPVDEVHQSVEVVLLKNTRAQELRTHWRTKQTLWESPLKLLFVRRGGDLPS